MTFEIQPDRRHPMPDVLRRRLMQIPRLEVRCVDRDRLYEATWRQAWQGRSDDDAAVVHLASCNRCKPVYDTLRAALGRTVPAPYGLLGRLRAVGRRVATIPWWIRQPRFGVAACWILAFVLASLAGSAQALLRDTKAGLSTAAETAEILAAESGERSREVLSSFSERLEHQYRRTRTALTRQTEPYQRLFAGVGALASGGLDADELDESDPEPDTDNQGR